MKMKTIISTALSALALFTLAGCSGNSVSAAADGASDFDAGKAISVVSREDGSGTRGAFIELFGVQETQADGTKKDMTTKEANIVNMTDVMMTNIASNPYAIGYISLGSLNGTVKALDIDGVKATTDNVKNGTYKISRPFVIATKGEPSAVAQDFIDFILSKEGQTVASDSYIPVDENAAAYAGSKPGGKVVVAGSSSVSPLMEKLIEEYAKVNAEADIELQTSDSSIGMQSTIDGICDIGMSSRELKDTEKAELTDTTIALDGLAVIVNAGNPMADIESAKIKSIYTGEATTWSEVQ